MSHSAGAAHPIPTCEPLEPRALLAGYTVTTLDPLQIGAGDQRAVYNGINKQGIVVGSVVKSGQPRAATCDAGGRIREIPLLPQTSYSFATAANDVGDAVVGDAYFNTGNRAYLYRAGKVAPLPGTGDGRSSATSVNNSATVVGHYLARGSPYRRPVMWAGGQMKVLGGGVGTALDVNNKNQVVGDSSFPNVSYSQAFLYSDGQFKSLGTLPGGSSSRAFSINDSGQVVGASFTAQFGVHAVLWSGGKMRDIGVLPGDVTCIAKNINGTGTIVGQSYGSAAGNRAVVWKPGANTPTDLNSFFPGATFRLLDASGVNDAGQIVAAGTDANRKFHLYLLTPKPDTIARPATDAPAPALVPASAPVAAPLAFAKSRAVVDRTTDGDDVLRK
jgi:probable HAF family extracellular repeat protein